jgi:hypothetical protein
MTLLGTKIEACVTSGLSVHLERKRIAFTAGTDPWGFLVPRARRRLWILSS